jgi:uncharacterized protein (DUF58 family)
MDTRELLKKVRLIEIKTRGMVNQVFSGEYHSVFKGRGMEFSEVREYQFGDDIRTIDWNVSARFNHPFVKVYEEERELTVMLVVDFSRSGSFGTARQLKNEIAAEICAVLAFSAIKNNDKVGLIMFTDRIEKFVPPKKGRAHILRIVRELISLQPGGTGTNIKAALEYFNHVNKKRSIAFIISDFIDDGYEQILRIISKKHDIIAVEVFDPREEELPDVGLMKMRDAETGEPRWIDTGDTQLRTTFRTYWRKRRADRKQLFLRSKVDAISIRIDKPYIKPIVDFFKLRESRL